MNRPALPHQNILPCIKQIVTQLVLYELFNSNDVPQVFPLRADLEDVPYTKVVQE